MDRFNICQAHAQLESDYNRSGIIIERPSNRRRNESTGCQLARMGFSNPYGWIDICADDEMEGTENEVREIYLANVLKWNLPIDAEMMIKIKSFFTSDFLAKFPQTAFSEYLQNGELACIN